MPAAARTSTETVVAVRIAQRGFPHRLGGLGGGPGLRRPAARPPPVAALDRERSAPTPSCPAGAMAARGRGAGAGRGVRRGGWGGRSWRAGERGGVGTGAPPRCWGRTIAQNSTSIRNPARCYGRTARGGVPRTRAPFPRTR
ncbi:hypothetical protein GCM10018793_33460 [Streptomyces sulfonofaciens]|uniref:Uncharacterized protein n=1 Tax=Streptomyces sulfonofaciens TaxID=68272 RepID=A0A919G827_9ACTN|nr:hypothetical protein GCM10018793_33460 [Streptomyces sulfonofaciens]